MSAWLAEHARDEYLYVTTRGRRTGRPHTIEIWFGTDCGAGDASRGAEGGADHGSLYLLSGGGDRSDWVRNLLADPRVEVRFADQTRAGQARLVTDPQEERRARRLLAAKYQDWREPQPMSHWAARALVVALDVAG